MRAKILAAAAADNLKTEKKKERRERRERKERKRKKKKDKEGGKLTANDAKVDSGTGTYV